MKFWVKEVMGFHWSPIEPPNPSEPVPDMKERKKKERKKERRIRGKWTTVHKQNKSPMDHYSLTYIFANAMQQSYSIATATGMQFGLYHKTAKGHPSFIILTNLVDAVYQDLASKLY